MKWLVAVLIASALSSSGCAKRVIIPDPTIPHELAEDVDVAIWVTAPDGKRVKQGARILAGSWVADPRLLALEPEQVAAPVGACVGLYYDAIEAVAVGDAILTATGRVYVVMALRRQRRGRHVGRYHLRCLVQREVPAGAKVHRLFWYRRGQRSGQPARRAQHAV